MATSNFEFLKSHDPVFFQMASAAELNFLSDPNTTLMKTRQLGEALTKDMAMRLGIVVDKQSKNVDLFFKVKNRLNLDQKIAGLFHKIRKEGNDANHEKYETSHKEAKEALIVTRDIAIWYHQAFGQQSKPFKPGKFVLPADPSKELRDLQSQIALLTQNLDEANQKVEESLEYAKLKEDEAQESEELANLMNEDAQTFKKLAEESEAELIKKKKIFDARVEATSETPDDSEQATKTTKKVKSQTDRASKKFNPTEATTRIMIDTQLRNAGWEVDTDVLRYSKGTRPEVKKNKAIAEWPAGTGHADYVLFCGLTPIASVEAKKKTKNVVGAIPQAERYNQDFTAAKNTTPAWEIEGLSGPWANGDQSPFQLPFAFACNGNPYLQQLQEQSGTWFRDCRKPSNLSRALMDFLDPATLMDLLKRDRAKAEEQLKAEGFSYLGLRDYQVSAVKAVEDAIENDQRACLLAMATGTGKTRTVLGLIYRFLKAERFKRILFLVDRTALGTQAMDAFHDTHLEQNHSLTQIYGVKALGDMAAEAETRVQVATVQAMVKRTFQSETPLPVGEFDCIIVDEAHRGYTLDKEMGEGEQAIRDAGQFLSTYRRVLDYFDAVRIALTATPAKHTTEIFGKPIFTYSYREAVAADWLIDHEPPIRYETVLNQNGIHFKKGQVVQVKTKMDDQLHAYEMEDELDFDVDQFNRKVINENFNRVVCKELVNVLDPFGDEKTMIFCVSIDHANSVKSLLSKAFKDAYPDEYQEAAVAVIVGGVDKVDQLIKRYKNERFPNIAITVDLLTTGIDVLKICNLVFFRRVKSRILYEQMKGRATRRCDEIGKTVFRIYDPVDLYATLEEVTQMKPIVKNPDITAEQLILEMGLPESEEAPGGDAGRTHADEVADQLNQTIMRVFRKAHKKAESNPVLRQHLDDLSKGWGIPAENLHKHLMEEGPEGTKRFLNDHENFAYQLEETKILMSRMVKTYVSEENDEVREITQSYGKHEEPGDYLESFDAFIREQINESAALSVVVQKPRELTRDQLIEIRTLLDQHGFSEAHLQSAWRNKTNQAIAASIIGFIRQAALGEALIPFHQRVDEAMTHIYAMTAWKQPQRKWLDRLAKQLKFEVILDQDFINRAFANNGGFQGLDQKLDGQLNAVIESVGEHLWEKAS